MARMRILVGILAANMATAVVAHAANLVPNPDFASDLSHWQGQGGSTFTFVASDGSPSPGSAELIAPFASGAVAFSDCIVIDASQNIDVSAMVKVNVGSGGGGVQVSPYSDAGCSTFIGGGAFASTTQIGAWVSVFSANRTLPANTHSVRINPFVNSTSGAAGDVSFDTIRFGPTGTTPVRLQSFDVE